MSKKIISLLLAVMLTVSMLAVAAVSVSAELDSNGMYAPGEDVETNRYYFYLPSDWCNDKANAAGIYWWEGTDNCETEEVGGWYGYNANPSDVAGVYYCDVPTDVTTIIWNNAFDGGSDETSPDYAKAIQSVNIGSEYYEEGDSLLYDEHPEYIPDETFDGMIYVIDPNSISVNDYNGKMTCGGEWYYYFGDGTYSYANTKEAAIEEGALYTTDYQPPKAEEPTTEEPTTEEATTEEPTTEEPTTEEETTEAPTSVDVVPYLTVNTTSNIFPAQTTVYSADTKEVKVTFIMQSDRNVVNTQWELHYDPTVLSISSTKNRPNKIAPVTGGVINVMKDEETREELGHVYGNASDLNMFDFTEAAPLVTITFDVVEGAVVEPTTTTVDFLLEILTTSDYNDEGLADDEQDVSVVKGYELIATPEEGGVNSFVSEVTPSNYEPVTEPTTEEPTTEEPTTEAPTTEEPTTEAPATEEPTTVAPATGEPATEPATGDSETTAPTEETTAADATSSTGVQVDGTSTNDNATGGNGAVQTGDASLALVILSLLIASTGVMFVLRKREMF